MHFGAFGCKIKPLTALIFILCNKLFRKPGQIMQSSRFCRILNALYMSHMALLRFYHNFLLPSYCQFCGCNAFRPDMVAFTAKGMSDDR